MIVILASHILLALAVWLISVKLSKKKHLTQALSIHRQVIFSYNNNKKRKPKKSKKKYKRQEYLQVVNYEDQVEEEIKMMEESDHQCSQKQEKQEKQQKPKEENQVSTNKIEAAGNENQVKAVKYIIQQQTKDQTRRKNTEIQICQIEVNQKTNSSDQPRQQELRLVKQKEVNQKDKVIEQIQLIRNYFIRELEQIVPYNRNYGHYKICIEGSRKSLTIQWKYTPQYPKQPLNLHINKQLLNPLEMEILDRILKDNLQKLQANPDYFYIFNLTTSIFQDLMISINDILQDQKSQTQQLKSQNEINQSFDLKMMHSAPQDLKIKKQIYGKILDQIFYLHDMIEKPDVSTMKGGNNQDQSIHLRQNNNRGRYESQFQELEMIGEGGFGKVYKVRHKLDGNIYAIKKAVVNYDDLNDRKMLKEVQLLSKLNHPNIVRYYQSWLQDTHSMQELNKDMEFSQNEQSKIDQLNQIYAKWKEEKQSIKFKNSSASQYEGSLVQNSDIVFEYGEQDSGIVFEDDDGEGMDVSENNSSINHAEQQGRNESQSSLMQGFRKFPFKILYIAMQLCSGINLRQFINHHFIEQEHKVQILRGILQGLAYIHAQKIIHRDLKPANIFLTDQKKVKIGDFGLATKQERSVSISLEQEESDFLGDKTKAVGTGFYRAPQQLKSKKYDEKADIYSVGIIMFELFFKFHTAMERTQTLKSLTNDHKLPKDFQRDYAGTDLLENIQMCLQQQPQKRPSASKLLQGFRNKYFTQLVSCIANPKHFQFSQLLHHLFAIKNEHGTFFMRRDAYKAYQTQKIMKIYYIHRATHFPTLPLVSIQDYNSLNGHKLKINRNQKYQLLTNRGLIVQYAYNCLKSWLIYARDAMRKKKGLSMDEQREAIRRFTFEKIVIREENKQGEIQFGQKMVTAFDLAYKLQNGFNAFYFCEVLKISQAIVLTLNLTQRTPSIYISHSQIYALLAKKYKVSPETLYQILLAINQDQFQSLTPQKRFTYLEQKNLPNNLCKILSNQFDQGYGSFSQFYQKMQLGKQGQIYQAIEFQMYQIDKVSKRVIKNPLQWRLGIPPSNCNGLFWQVATVRGLTTIQQYVPGQGLQLCNYHIQCTLDQQSQEPDVSLWCIGEYLEEQMQKMILECWKNGLSTKWYQWQVGQKQDKCRHNIILKRRNERVHVMIRHNDMKKGQNREDRQSSFISLDQFNMDVIKQMSATINQLSYH